MVQGCQGGGRLVISHWIKFDYWIGQEGQCQGGRCSVYNLPSVPEEDAWRGRNWDGSEATNDVKFGSWLFSRPPLLLYFRCVGILFFAITHLSA